MITLKEYIAQTTPPESEDPDPENLATEICVYCGFPIMQREVSTGNRSKGPFWQLVWVHTNTFERRCDSPYATPSGKFSSKDEGK